MQLAYDAEGAGPLIVLLHGFPESRLTWRRHIAPLAQAGFRVVAPDLRGYGDSPKPRGADAYLMTAVVEDVAALIESEGGAPCVVAGHDWGAVVAWNLAMVRPELVRKLVIMNVPHPAAIKRELRRSMRQRLNLLYQLFFQLPVAPELFMRLFGRSLLRRAGRFTSAEIDAYARQWRSGSLTPMLNYYRAIRRSRGMLRRMFRPIDVPTLILWGEREPVFLRSTLEDVGEWVRNARVEIIPRAGHFVQIDQPERVTQLLTDFAATPTTARPPT